MSKYKKSYGKFSVNRKNKYASDCGAGKEGAGGFQPGNTCAGGKGGSKDEPKKKKPKKSDTGSGEGSIPEGAKLHKGDYYWEDYNDAKNWALENGWELETDGHDNIKSFAQGWSVQAGASGNYAGQDPETGEEVSPKEWKGIDKMDDADTGEGEGGSSSDMKKLVDERKVLNPSMASFLYALQDSGITNMAGAGEYLANESFWGYKFDSPEGRRDASQAISEWAKEVEAGGREADPTFDQNEYDESVVSIDVYFGDGEETDTSGYTENQLALFREYYPEG
ncbi:MAG: hypothetical protein Unbinned97contig1000_48 [Prokaryotic dsDNA virus sp.]|nr:MAG: hypothetical protein Unbinned97contig1000_48 [Prokaryotic dsDNA virus sp.]|tara:strand:+ start:6218 stop:7057 length:840 start_codon:yes stop_codon:yes gene_type:complete